MPDVTHLDATADELVIGGLGRNLALYPDAAMRLAVSRCVALETPRGWRIAKEKQSHKIDCVIALAMSAHAAVEGGQALGLASISEAAWQRILADVDLMPRMV